MDIPPARTKRRRSATPTSAPTPKRSTKPRAWTTVTSIDDLEVPQAVEHYVRENDDAVTDLTRPFQAASPLLSGNHAVDVSFELVTRFAATLQLEKGGHQGQLADAMRLYAYLSWFDVFKILHKAASSYRVPEPSSEQVCIIFSSLLDQLESFSPNDASSSIPVWVRYGKKLDKLCADFGDGLPLLLYPHLTAVFLESQCPMRGQAYATAMAHLNELDARGLAEEHGLDVLGASIRTGMISSIAADLRLLTH